MANVLIDRQKIDILANAISDKSGVPITMTLEEMVDAVDGIESNPAPTLQAKTYTVDSAGTETVTADSGYDGLSSVNVSVPIADLIIDESHEFYIVNGIKKWRVKGYADDDDGALKGWFEGSQSGGYTSFNAVPSGTSVTPTESSQTIGGTNYMMEGAVTVNAIPSNYVGSGITRRSSTDLTASGATVTVPSGYYSAQASKAVTSGTAGTPTATKGTVSNHQVSVTPSVTNTAGYISGGTISGTAVTVSASELVSGSDTVTTNDTYDVTNLAELIVNVSGGGGIAVEALNVTQNGTYTAPTGKAYSPVTVNVSGGASNVVTGTFTGTTTGAAMTVDIQNSGNKRPIAFFIYPSAGMYNPNGTFYTTKQRYAILSFFAVRNVFPIPTDDSAGSTVVRYKNSTTNATTYTQAGGTGNIPFSTSAPTDTSASTAAKVSINSNGTKLKVFIASGSYGFMANVEYTYYIIFES